MKVKSAYYAHAFPTMIVIIMPDGHTVAANMAPFRTIKEAETVAMPALDNKVARAACLRKCDELPEWAYMHYGLEKIQV